MQSVVALRCVISGIFRELITTTRRITTRVAFGDPPSGSKNMLMFSELFKSLTLPSSGYTLVVKKKKKNVYLLVKRNMKT